MKKVILSGPDLYLTLNSKHFFTIEEGKVVVFAAPVNADKTTGRRMFICELQKGDTIPAMHIKNDALGEWTFILTGLGSAEVSENENCDEDIILKFARKIKLNLFSAQDFAEEIVERVNLRLISEEGYIYAVSQEQKKTYQKGLSVIYNLFNKSDKKSNINLSDNHLYNTVKYVCSHEGIDTVSFDTVKDAVGRKFTIDDISRLSHFINRQVILEPDWYKNDSGALIVFRAEDNHALACIPKGTNKYIVHDCETGETIPLSENVARTISPKAVMVYRPFKNKKLSAKDLFSFAVSSLRRADIISMVAFAFLGAIVGLLLPYLNEKIFDNYIPLSDTSSLVQVSMLILIFSISNLSFTIVKNLAIFRMSSVSQINTQSAVFDRLYNLPNSFFGKYESADLANRAVGISSIIKLLSETVLVTGLSALFSLLYLFRMFKYSSKLTWIGIVLILVNMLITFFFGFIQIKYEKKLTERKSSLNSLIYQMLTGISKIRIAGVEDRALLQYFEPYVDIKRIHIKKERLDNLATNINAFMGVVFSAIFYYIMISQELEITFGAFMAFVSAFGSFSAAMISVVSSFLNFNDAIPVYKRAKEILETPQELSDDVLVPGKLSGKIEIDNLSFRYGKEEDMVINDLSFSINPGEYIGIVGPSGCGKSTLLKILLGFELPTYGKVYYDDKDIESLDKRELRKRFGVVLQDGQLISGSIFENITITGDNISTDRVQQVIKDVGLEKDIAEMPMGLHTVISEGAGTISGGQRQRILIARAIVNKPDVLLFDEATSALDNVNQDLVCKSLEKLNTTRIVVAHRLSTIMKCDRILVIDAGQLVEQGTYSELIAKKGAFYELAKRQMV